LKIPAPSDFDGPPSSADTSVLAFPSEKEENAVAPGSGRKSREMPRRSFRMRPLAVRSLTALMLAIVVLETAYLGRHAVAGSGRPRANQRAVLPARSITSPFAASLHASYPLAASLVGSPPSPAAGPVETGKPAPESRGPGTTSSPAPQARRAESPRPSVELPPVDPPGWASLDLPIQVQVFEHGRFVGTNDTGRVTLAAGSHELEIVNESLEFRSRQVVNIRPDSLVPVPVTLPSGTLSLNALPWSDVQIDGQAVGTTPLGHVRLSIGPHRVVFRHPQLGEQIRTAVISVGNETRLVVDLRK
jgi:hypothetical protein